jgi:GNAT superfamily N-acetyltransferase
MLIQPAAIKDASRISNFVTCIAVKQIGPTLSDAGIKHLLAEMSTENQAERIRLGFQFFIASDDSVMVGVVAIRLPSHLYYLFVDPDRQRQGIGRQLWTWARDWARDSFKQDTFTVNSSLNAVEAYERFGFVTTGPIEEMHGVRYQPMRFATETGQPGPGCVRLPNE